MLFLYRWSISFCTEITGVITDSGNVMLAYGYTPELVLVRRLRAVLNLMAGFGRMHGKRDIPQCCSTVSHPSSCSLFIEIAKRNQAAFVYAISMNVAFVANSESIKIGQPNNLFRTRSRFGSAT